MPFTEVNTIAREDYMELEAAHTKSDGSELALKLTLYS